MNTLCYFINASYYRENIYKKLNDNLNCDFIIGEKVSNIKEMDLNLLTNLKLYFKRKRLIGPLYYDQSVFSYFLENRKKYDTLIVGGDAYSITVWIILVLSRLSGVKTMLWTHGWYGRESKIRIIFKKLFFGFANRILVYGDHAKQGLANNNIVSLKKSVIVYNSLDYEKQLHLRNQVKVSCVYKDHFNNNYSNLVFIGRLTKSKKLEMLLDAAKILANKGVLINITFIGGGEELNNLENHVKLYSLNNVWFYGACYNQKILSDLIFNADLCVSPGEVGLTAMHSMMFGTPVITHNNFAFQGPEYEAVKKGETGDFFKKDNVQSLAESILNWLNNGQSREIIRAKCYNIIDTCYNPQNQLNIIHNTIKELQGKL